MGYSDSIPVTGTYKVGDFIISNTQTNGIFGWACTKAGTPGTWEIICSGKSKVNEAFQSDNNAKQGLVDALITHGVKASTSETWESLNNKVRNLDVNKLPSIPPGV